MALTGTTRAKDRGGMKTTRVSYTITLPATLVVELDRLGAAQDPPRRGRELAQGFLEQAVRQLLDEEKKRGTASRPATAVEI